MFCCWRGNLFAAKEKRSLCELKLYEQNKWMLERQCDLPSKFESIDVVKVVLNSRLGYHVPFILASCYTTSASQLRTKFYHILMYDIVSDNDDLLPSYGYFDVPKPNTPTESNGFALVSGPVVFWSEDCGPMLHVVHGVNDVGKMSHDIIDVQKYVKEYTVKCIDKLWVFDWEDGAREDQCDMFILFMRLILDGQEESRAESDSGLFKWICLSIKAKYACRCGFAVQFLPASSFIPCEYGYIATCVTLYESFSADFSAGDIVVKNQFIVGTSYNQVVVFEEGVLLCCITTRSIPQSVVAIQTMLDCVMIAVHLQTREVCTYKTNKSISDAHQSWQGISNIIAGDFASLGHEQLLLCPDGGINDCNLVVTDFGQFTTEVRTEAVDSHKPCPESLLSAVKALELRKHSGEAFLTDKEREMQRKSQLFESSIHLLSSLGFAKSELDTATKCDPSLICIIPGSSDVARASNSTASPPVAPLKITSLWKILINEHWTVGMVVKNISLEDIHSLWFSLVTSDNDQLESICKVIPFRKCASQYSDNNQPSPPSKKPRLDTEPITERKLLDNLWSEQTHLGDNSQYVLVPDGEVCVVLSIPLSSSFVHEREAMIIACWKLTQDYGAPVHLRGMTPIQISLEQVGQDTFDHSDKCMQLWEGTMELIMKDDTKAFQDLACVLGTRAVVQIAVQSTHTNLLCLSSTVKAKMPFLSHIPKIAVDSSSQQDLFLSSGGTGVIGDGLVLLITSSSSSASIVIMYKSVAQLTMFVGLLKRYLSEDVCLSLDGETHSEKALVQTLTRIRNEVDKEDKRIIS